MLKLKTVSLLKHRSDLSVLPEGKLLINTINAHSYNTALKDDEFAEDDLDNLEFPESMLEEGDED